MAYTHTSFGSAKTQLAARLHDSSKVFWIDAELGGYIAEALRTWQLLSGYWREQASFATTVGTVFYSLAVMAPTQRATTLTDRDLVTDIEYHLLEAPTPSAWTGTAQFTLADVSAALQRRQNQFLVETGVGVSRTTIAVTASTTRVSLIDSTIDIRRVAWYTVTGGLTTYSHLFREDEWSMTTFNQVWPAATGTPSVYSVAASPPVTLALSPVPTVNGLLEILYVPTGTDLNPAVGVTLSVPDDMAWIVKFGALADLLSKDGPANDPFRAEYCEKRYQQGVELARLFAPVVAARIGSTALTLVPLADLDGWASNWQNNASALPTVLAAASINLLAAYPIPSAASTVTLDLLKNAPVPANDAAQLQLGREELETVLGYAEHLAMFKVGGREFQDTFRYHDELLRLAGVYNERLNAAVRYFRPLWEQARQEEMYRPRRTAATPPEPRQPQKGGSRG